MSASGGGSATPQAQPARPGPALRISGPQVSPSLRKFLTDEAGGGAALLIATVLALLWANSPWWPSYEEFWHTDLAVSFGEHSAGMDLIHLVNDAAMSVFFLVLGLEISRQVTSGELGDRRTVLVPTLGAIGGMVVPVALYLSVNWGTDAAHGWGVVMSSDTAFVLGLLALFGPRCPDQLRLFLLALAVVDDVAAVTVMAVFYSDSVRLAPMVTAAGLLVAIFALRWLGVWRLGPYIALAVALWFAVYESGVHPTLAGVLVGLLISARPSRSDQLQRLRVFGRALIEVQTAQRARLAALAAAASVSPAERLERLLHPWSAYLVVPIFGLANAGVHLDADAVRTAASSPITHGTVLGLVLGNAVGITAASGLALRLGLGVLPGRVRYSHLVGGAILAGIGFTISLFIAELAFDDEFLREQAKIGILAGSAIAAVLGAAVLRVMGERSPLCSPPGELAPPELPPLPWTAPAPPTLRT
ncbi:MAG: Na+/H+ antiporter NhaA [Pseudonocardiaceae bacterium]